MPIAYFLSELPSGEGEKPLNSAKEGPGLAALHPCSDTFHVAFPQIQPEDGTFPSFAPSSPRSSLEDVVISRRHFVVHGPSCRPEMQCDLRAAQGPAVVARSVGLPRAHVVRSSRDPTPYNLNELWARPLSSGPLIGVGDRIWVEGLGEVKLGESFAASVSPFWRFFSACTKNYRILELATEWKFVRLTSEEYERRASFPYVGRGVGPVAVQQQSFLNFEEHGSWLQGWIRVWRGMCSRFVAIFIHQADESAA